MVLAWEDGDGFPCGNGLIRALERGPHGAGVDQEGFGLVSVPMHGWDVDREAGFDVTFHAVFGGGVVGEEVDFGLAIFGPERVLGGGMGSGDWGGEEGKHGFVELYVRFLEVGCGRRVGFGGMSIR